jgi:hypothetical protein
LPLGDLFFTPLSCLVLGGSNFRLDTNTQALRNSQCTSIPIPEDKSNYWFPVCINYYHLSYGAIIDGTSNSIYTSSMSEIFIFVYKSSNSVYVDGPMEVLPVLMAAPSCEF